MTSNPIAAFRNMPVKKLTEHLNRLQSDEWIWVACEPSGPHECCLVAVYDYDEELDQELMFPVITSRAEKFLAFAIQELYPFQYAKAKVRMNNGEFGGAWQTDTHIAWNDRYATRETAIAVVTRAIELAKEAT